MTRYVFCDFDGTITREELFESMLRTFAGKKAEEVIPKLDSGDLTLREGVREMLESIRSDKFTEMMRCYDNIKVRPGLTTLLAFLRTKDARMVVVTGGLQIAAEKVLHKHLGSVAAELAGIHGMSLDTTDQKLKVVSEWEDGDELVSKVKVMDHYEGREGAVAIGDGLSDRHIAEEASVVFARSKLAKFLKKNDREYYPFKDFHDVRETLEKLWR